MEFHPLSWHRRARALSASNYSNFGPFRIALQLIKMSAFQDSCTFFSFFPHSVNSTSKYLLPSDLVLQQRTVLEAVEGGAWLKGGGGWGGGIDLFVLLFYFSALGLINASGESHSWRRGGKPEGENKEQRATRGAAIKLFSSC